MAKGLASFKSVNSFTTTNGSRPRRAVRQKRGACEPVLALVGWTEGEVVL